MAVLAAQVDLQLRVLADELDQQRCQHPPPEGHRGADAQLALYLRLRLQRHVVGLLHLVGDAPAMLGIQGTHLGHRNALRRAVQQTRAQVLFQLGDLLGDAGLTHTQVDRRLAERSQLHHADEGVHGRKFVHPLSLGGKCR